MQNFLQNLFTMLELMGMGDLHLHHPSYAIFRMPHHFGLNNANCRPCISLPYNLSKNVECNSTRGGSRIVALQAFQSPNGDGLRQREVLAAASGGGGDTTSTAAPVIGINVALFLEEGLERTVGGSSEESNEEAIISSDLYVEESDNEAPQEDEEDDDEEMVGRVLPYRVAFKKFKLASLQEIQAAVDENWPQWANNRYWLKRTGVHGGSTEVALAPTPDEAIGIMWAIGTATTAGRRKPNWQQTVPHSALMKGLVECLRLTPARRPPWTAGLAANSRQQKKIARYGAPGMRKKGKNKNKDGGDGAAAAVIATTTAAGSLPTEVTPPAISAAIFCLGWLDDGDFIREMNELCNRLPQAEFSKTMEVYNVLWSLRRQRHWTPHLPLLESEAVRLFTASSQEEGLTRRQLRHAGNCAQGLVYLSHVPRDLLDALATEIEEHWDWRAVCSISWAAAIANVLDSPVVPQLVLGLEANAAKGLEAGFPRKATLSKVYQLFKSLERLKPEMVHSRKKEWSPSMKTLIDASQAEWKELVQGEKKLISAVQRDVYKSMCSLGYAAQLEVIACELSVDVAVRNIKLAVEVDGFAHFARNRPDVAVGNSLWKRRMLEANGWMVVNVNVVEWDKKRGAEEKREFLKSAIEIEEQNKVERKTRRRKMMTRRSRLRKQRKKVKGVVEESDVGGGDDGGVAPAPAVSAAAAAAAV